MSVSVDDIAGRMREQRQRDVARELWWYGGPYDRNLVSRAQSPHPMEALVAVRALRQALPRLEERAVAGAREAGWAWASIARLLRRSRQSVHRQYADRMEPADRPPAGAAPGGSGGQVAGDGGAVR